MLKSDYRVHKNGDPTIGPAYARHLIAVAIVLVWVWGAQMPLWAYLLAVYLGNAILRIRIFIEHRADEHAAGRTVIIEDRGILAFSIPEQQFPRSASYEAWRALVRASEVIF